MNLEQFKERLKDTEKSMPLPEVLIDLYTELERVKMACVKLNDELGTKSNKRVIKKKTKSEK